MRGIPTCPHFPDDFPTEKIDDAKRKQRRPIEIHSDFSMCPVRPPPPICARYARATPARLLSADQTAIGGRQLPG
jgi:hypothetical protein